MRSSVIYDYRLYHDGFTNGEIVWRESHCEVMTSDHRDSSILDKCFDCLSVYAL